MAKFIDITGQKFHKLTAIEYRGNERWLFQCECGNLKEIRKSHVTRGKIQSCGCLCNEPRLDIIGKRYGRLVVTGYRGNNKWECQCDCGNIVTRISNSLTRSENPSCGCFNRERFSAKTHGYGGTKMYSAWNAMCQRCTNPKNTSYRNYGGRGIKVCDRWLGEHGFENFLTDMGERPSDGYSIDRIDNNGDYCPENCRWATKKEQCNNMRKTIMLSYNGETHSLSEWCDITGFCYETAYNRYRKGYDFETIFRKGTLQKNKNVI